MDMINIIDFLCEKGEQTVQGQLDYIRTETAQYGKDQVAILKWLVKQGLLPSSDAVTLYGEVEKQIAQNEQDTKRLSIEQAQTIEDEIAQEETHLKNDICGEITFYIASLLVGLLFGSVLLVLLVQLISNFSYQTNQIVGIIATSIGSILMIISIINSTRGAQHMIRASKYTREMAEDYVHKGRQSREIKLKELSNDTEQLTNCYTILKIYTDKNGLIVRGLA